MYSVVTGLYYSYAFKTLLYAEMDVTFTHLPKDF
jgi:hypothetical protein